MITDLNYLKTMSGGDSKFIREMISLFRDQIEEYKSIMPELLQNKDYDGLSKVAHKAKSSVAVMGMAEVAELLKELDEVLADSNLTDSDCLELGKKLKKEIAKKYEAST